MIRKSAWLFSAAMVATATPAIAQQASTQPTQPDTTQTNATPTQGATANAAAVDNQALEQQPVDTGDIVITATRRNQALSDVPMAVSAVTADTLQNSGATDIRQLTQLSPSLLVSSTTSEGGAAVARIRGVGTVGDNPGLEGSVATYIDGVYRSRTGVALNELGPLDRIEVLRGPQGTLFGRNASAGVISVITAKPQFTPFVSGAASFGNYDYRRIEASLNGPLSDTIAARLDGVWVKRDGFLKDVISGRRVNNRDRYLFRGQILYQPSDDFSVRLIADYSRQNEECCAAVYLPAHNFIAGTGQTPSSIAAIERSLGAIINDDPYKRLVSITPGRSDRSDVHDGGVSAEVNYDFGSAQLTSISAYRTNKFVGGTDADFNNLDFFNRPDDGGFGNKFRTFTQELRLQGTTMNGRLDWLVGGFYADEKATRRDNLSFGPDADLFFGSLVRANPPLAGFPGYNNLNLFAQGFTLNQLSTNPLLAGVPAAAYPLVIGAIAGQVANTPLNNVTTSDRFDQNGRNYAIFTHNIFKITDQLSLTLGGRYTVDHKKLSADLTSTSQCAAFLGNIQRLQQLAAASAADPTGNGGLNPAIAALASGLAGTVLTPLAAAPCGPINSVNGNFSGGREKENKFSGTAVLSYKPTEQLLTYASFSRGYKAGGFNLDRAGLTFGAEDLNALRFHPELVDAYELGAKFNGRGLDVNVALFDEEFRNFQLNTFNGINFVVENINSCSSDLGGADTDNSGAAVPCSGHKRPGVRSRGVEVETFFRPIPEVNGSLGATYADTRYRDNLIGTNGNALIPALFQLPGRQISNAPKWTVTGSLGWTPPIGGTGMHALFYVDGRHTSSYNTGSDLDIEKLQKAFTTINARVGVRGADEMWSIEAWAQNLFNTKYMQVAADAPLQGSGTQRGAEAGFGPSTGLFIAFLGEPRTFGLTLRGKLGFARPVPPPMPVIAPPPPPPPAVQTCADGSVVAADAACPLAPPPPPPPPVERGERGE